MTEEPKHKSIFVRISPTLHTLLSHRAVMNQRSLNVEVNLLIRDALGVNGTSYGYKEGGAITGEDLVQWRKSKDLTQRALSALMNVPAETISRWENGHNNISRAYQDKFTFIQKEFQ